MNTLIQRIKTEIDHWARKTWTFESVAAHWDATEDYDEINAETYSYFRRFVDGLHLSDLRDSGIILDFCARTGNGTTFFHQHGKVRGAICADVSFKMGAICTTRLQKHGLGNYLWVPVMSQQLPFGDRVFDSVLCFETVEHFPQPAWILTELSRVTRPGGVLILTTPNTLWEPIHALAAITGLHHSEGPHRFIPYRRLRAMVSSAGFEIVKAATTVLIPGGPAWLVRLGEWLEKHTQRTLMPILGLRRIIIARKI